MLGVSACHVHQRWACPYSGCVILLVTATSLTHHGPISRETECSLLVSMKVCGHLTTFSVYCNRLINDCYGSDVLLAVKNMAKVVVRIYNFGMRLRKRH